LRASTYAHAEELRRDDRTHRQRHRAGRDDHRHRHRDRHRRPDRHRQDDHGNHRRYRRRRHHHRDRRSGSYRRRHRRRPDVPDRLPDEDRHRDAGPLDAVDGWHRRRDAAACSRVMHHRAADPDEDHQHRDRGADRRHPGRDADRQTQGSGRGLGAAPADEESDAPPAGPMRTDCCLPAADAALLALDRAGRGVDRELARRAEQELPEPVPPLPGPMEG
jgi:hypothetical protein